MTLVTIARGLLPPWVSVAGGAIADWQQPLPPVEALAIRAAVSARRADFAAGRNAARAALGHFGLQADLPRRADGPPVWPTGFTGSIAHAGGTCLAAVARLADARAVGVDLERAGGLAADLVAEVLGPQEIATLGADDPTRWFCAKEAAYKAHFMIVGRMLGFHDLTVIPRDGAWQVQVADMALTVRLGQDAQGMIVAATWIPA